MDLNKKISSMVFVEQTRESKTLLSVVVKFSVSQLATPLEPL